MNKEPPNPESPVVARAGATVFHRSYPLVALLQLVAFCAALAACVDGARLGNLLDDIPRWPDAAWAAIVVALIAGGAIGGIIGLGQYSLGRSLAKGLLIGTSISLAMLCVYAAPAPPERAAAAAGVLVLTTFVVRLRAP